MLAGYTPLKWQIRAHLHDVDNVHVRTQKLLICGLGAGKTDFGVAEGVSLALMNPGVPGLVTAPSYGQLKNEIIPRWQRMTGMLKDAGLAVSRRFHGTDFYDEWFCGTKIHFKPMARVDLLRGIEYGWWWGDEIESLTDPEYVWTVLSARVRHPHARVRQAFGSSTPKGLHGTVALFHKSRQNIRSAQHKEIDGVPHVPIPGMDPEETIWVPRRDALGMWWTTRATARDNPYLPADYFSAMQGFSERRWREEVEAEILLPEALVWPEFDSRRHGIDWPRQWIQRGSKAVPNPRFDRSLPWDLAFDWGDAYPHALWIQRRPDGVCIVVDEYALDQRSRSEVHDAIVWRSAMMGKQPENIVGDRAVPRELGWAQEQFPNARIRKMVTRQEQDVADGIETVRDRIAPFRGEPKLLIANHLIQAPGRRGIWKCVKNYGYKKYADGTLSREPHKDNVHDHGADALRYHQVALYQDRAGRAYSVGRRY